MTKRVGIVGIGIMGTAMMRNLVKDGFEVVGYDIADGAMARLAEAGGIAVTSPRDAAEQAEILITSLPSVDAFEQVTAQVFPTPIRDLRCTMRYLSSAAHN